MRGPFCDEKVRAWLILALNRLAPDDGVSLPPEGGGEGGGLAFLPLPRGVLFCRELPTLLAIFRSMGIVATAAAADPNSGVEVGGLGVKGCSSGPRLDCVDSRLLIFVLVSSSFQESLSLFPYSRSSC